MNKRIIAALIAASGLVAFNASANDGTVNFIGDMVIPPKNQCMNK